MSLKYNPLGGDKPQDEEKEKPANGISYYKTMGNIRNLRLVKLDGTSYFFNYAFFGPVKYSPEKSFIAFQSQGFGVYMKGYRLEELFIALSSQLPMEIRCVDPRYVDETVSSEPIVTRLVVRAIRSS